MNDIAARIQVRGQVMGCRACGLRTGCKAPVPFSGANPSPIVVIGEAPGREEDEAGRPFVGPAGRFLRLSLDRVMGEGWADTVAYVNVVSCYPARTPTAEEVVECKENLVSQVRCLEPWYCLVLGGVAVSAFWPRLRIGEVRGRWWAELGLGGIVGGAQGSTGERRRAWMFATYHPSAVLRAGGPTSKIGGEFMDDLGRFASVITDWKRPGLEVDCVKCGRGDRKGMAEIWERNIGACSKHAPLAGIGSASSVKSRRGGGVQGRAKPSATLRRRPGSSVTRGTLFD